MKYHQLRALVAAHDEGGIRAAARALDLAQGAITKAIRELESDTGVPLLERGAKGIGFTGFGLRLVARARCIITQMDAAQRDLVALRTGADAQLDLGVAPLIGMTMLAPLLIQLRRAMPLLTVRVVDALGTGILTQLRQGCIDLATVAWSPDIGGEFTYARLATVPIAIVAGRGRRAPPCRSLAGLVDTPWILSSDVEAAVLGAFAARSLPPPRQIVRVDDLLAALSLAANSDFVLALPAPLAADDQLDGLIDVLPLREVLPNVEYGLLHLADQPLSPAAERCAALMTRMAGLVAVPAGTTRPPMRPRLVADEGLRRSA